MTISEQQALSDAGIARALEPFGVPTSSALAGQIRAYIELLLRWNQKISLTSIARPEAILQRHFGESMFAAQAVPMVRGRLIDVGAGAGFPGLALKLASPELEVMLVEANQKKAAFLGEVVRTLELKGARVLAQRIEELQGANYAAEFVSCRAVRTDKKLIAFAGNALASGGSMVFWVGTKEAEAIREQGGWVWRKPVPIPLSTNRLILVGRKDQP